MKKRVSKELTLFFDKNFPFIEKSHLKTTRSSKRHTALLGVGANIGNSRRRFQKLFLYLQKNPLLEIIETSPILKNPPFGYIDQEYFFNCVILIKTNLSAHRLLRFCQRVEHIFKRKRAFKNSPRTLDIDIIVFDKIAVNKRDLTLPHPGFCERLSVLIPLSYLKRGLYETLHIYGAYSRTGAKKGAARLRRRSACGKHETGSKKNSRSRGII